MNPDEHTHFVDIVATTKADHLDIIIAWCGVALHRDDSPYDRKYTFDLEKVDCPACAALIKLSDYSKSNLS